MVLNSVIRGFCWQIPEPVTKEILSHLRVTRWLVNGGKLGDQLGKQLGQHLHDPLASAMNDLIKDAKEASAVLQASIKVHSDHPGMSSDFLEVRLMIDDVQARRSPGLQKPTAFPKIGLLARTKWRWRCWLLPARFGNGVADVCAGRVASTMTPAHHLQAQQHQLAVHRLQMADERSVVAERKTNETNASFCKC